LSGGEILQLFQQQAARDKSIVLEANPVVGAGPNAIEHEDDGSAQ
jgi:hypothetical protein